MHTPGLGIHFAQTDTAGNVVIGEDRIRYAMEISAGDMFELQRELQVAGLAPESLDLAARAEQAAAVLAARRRLDQIRRARLV